MNYIELFNFDDETERVEAEHVDGKLVMEERPVTDICWKYLAKFIQVQYSCASTVKKLNFGNF